MVMSSFLKHCDTLTIYQFLGPTLLSLFLPAVNSQLIIIGQRQICSRKQFVPLKPSDFWRIRVRCQPFIHLLTYSSLKLNNYSASIFHIFRDHCFFAELA